MRSLARTIVTGLCSLILGAHCASVPEKPPENPVVYEVHIEEVPSYVSPAQISEQVPAIANGVCLSPQEARLEERVVSVGVAFKEMMIDPSSGKPIKILLNNYAFRLDDSHVLLTSRQLREIGNDRDTYSVFVVQGPENQQIPAHILAEDIDRNLVLLRIDEATVGTGAGFRQLPFSLATPAKWPVEVYSPNEEWVPDTPGSTYGHWTYSFIQRRASQRSDPNKSDYKASYRDEDFTGFGAVIRDNNCVSFAGIVDKRSNANNHPIIDVFWSNFKENGHVPGYRRNEDGWQSIIDAETVMAFLQEVPSYNLPQTTTINTQPYFLETCLHESQARIDERSVHLIDPGETEGGVIKKGTYLASGFLLSEDTALIAYHAIRTFPYNKTLVLWQPHTDRTEWAWLERYDTQSDTALLFFESDDFFKGEEGVPFMPIASTLTQHTPLEYHIIGDEGIVGNYRETLNAIEKRYGRVYNTTEDAHNHIVVRGRIVEHEISVDTDRGNQITGVYPTNLFGTHGLSGAGVVTQINGCVALAGIMVSGNGDYDLNVCNPETNKCLPIGHAGKSSISGPENIQNLFIGRRTIPITYVHK